MHYVVQMASPGTQKAEGGGEYHLAFESLAIGICQYPLARSREDIYLAALTLSRTFSTLGMGYYISNEFG